MSRYILFLSNCHGEDRSAALIAKELKKLKPDIKVAGAPLISSGEEYTKRKIPVIIKSKIPPSGGFPTKSFTGFLMDLPTFYIPLRYYFILRKVRTEVDFSVVVGDIFLLVLGYFALKKETIFLAPAKSDYQRPHYRIEEFFMRKIPRKVLTHDEYTAKNLRKKGINALFLGNPMMDDLHPKGISLGEPPIVGLLPGSRLEAYKNFLKILKVVEKIKEKVSFACAIPSSLNVEKIVESAKKEGWNLQGNTLRKGEKSILLVKDGFEDVISKSNIIIGLAGTANEQAAGLGKPVISFAGCGPQTTPGRMRDQARLLGEAVKFVSDFPEGVISEISYLLANPEERKRRGKIGSLRMGPPGGARKIAELIVEEFGLKA